MNPLVPDAEEMFTDGTTTNNAAAQVHVTTGPTRSKRLTLARSQAYATMARQVVDQVQSEGVDELMIKVPVDDVLTARAALRREAHRRRRRISSRHVGDGELRILLGPVDGPIPS